jgi:predicted aconitase with swiveling domain
VDFGVDLALLGECLRGNALLLVSGHGSSVGTVRPTVTTQQPDERAAIVR